MPFDPSKPADHAPLASAEMRSQLASLNTDIQTRMTTASVNALIASALSTTSNNSNGVGTLGQTAQSFYDQTQIQSLIDKIDELINALRR